MAPPRWRKVWRDVVESPIRSSIAVCAMAAGVFGVGAILTSYAVLRRELATTFEATRPASATILVSTGTDDGDLAAVRGVPGVGDAEARPAIAGRIRVGEEEWVPLILFVIADFQDLRIDKFKREAGAWPPDPDAVLLERTALSVARTRIGDSVRIKAGDGTERTLRVAGSVHAPGLPPAWMDHMVSGFVGPRSFARVGASEERGAIRIVVAGDRLDPKHIREVAGRARAALEARGRVVSRIDIPPPGRHPHADQMDTFLFLLGAFAALTLALSAVLTATMIHALLGEQVRQIGVMKALGATTSQVAALYLGQVALLAGVALCIGMPLGLWAGLGYARFAGAMLNASIVRTAVPAGIIAVEIAVGLCVPLLVALWPVFRVSRITIHEAFGDSGPRRPFGSRRLDRWLARVRWAPRPLLLSLRTGLERRGRLALTVATLAAGGAVFVSALNVSAAWSRALESDARTRRYDLDTRLARPYPIGSLVSAVAAVPEIERAEYWADAGADLVEGEGGEARISLVAPDTGSTLLAPRLVAGRWLRGGDRGVVVVNQGLLSRAPGLQVGGDVRLRVNGKVAPWRIVGVVNEIDPTPTAYATPRDVREAAGQLPGVSRSIRVVTRGHDAAAQLSASRDLERALSRRGIGVLHVLSLLDRRKAFEDHLVIIESALLLAAGLVVLVGGLGLTSALSLNVVERTREIGVLGAIGATPRAISRNIVLEGVLTGLVSWCLGILVAVPVTLFLDRATGQIFIRSALELSFSPGAAALSLAVMVALAAICSFYPARRSARLVVKEALAHA